MCDGCVLHVKLVCSQGMPGGIGECVTGMGLGKNVGGEGLCAPLGMGSEIKGRSKQASRHKAEDQTWGDGTSGAVGDV